MKIFIPMAGKGTRLRPFTLTQPKPLLEIIHKPIVEHLINQITSTLLIDIEEIITNAETQGRHIQYLTTALVHYTLLHLLLQTRAKEVCSPPRLRIPAAV